MRAEALAGEDALFLLEQTFRYTYASPVRRLRHRLVVVPPPVHGDQYRFDHGLTVSGGTVRMSVMTDSFANHVVELRAASVAEWIEFDTWAVVGRRGTGGAIELSSASTGQPQFLAPSPLTQADDLVTETAADLSAASTDTLDLAERACAWSHQALTYEYDVTGVHTTAVTALAEQKGVCQDYAHVMLAVCRQAGLPARYISGHLMGEGGSHAWVEVLISDPHNGRTAAVAFDPTHGRRATQGYITVAVGRDYSDVAPTSGTFVGSCPGVLSTRKRLSRANPEQGPPHAGAGNPLHCVSALPSSSRRHP
jgi:transglutaminase-like putative cysteine protease